MSGTDFAQRARIAQNNCERNGHVLVGFLATAMLHLYVVVAVRTATGYATGTYTTWVMNTEQAAHECLNLGHYDLPTLAEAYADALEREHF